MEREILEKRMLEFNREIEETFEKLLVEYGDKIFQETSLCDVAFEESVYRDAKYYKEHYYYEMAEQEKQFFGGYKVEADDLDMLLENE